MADDLGAVRRTARLTGDRQTPETAPQESAGTTNTASPVSGDHQAVSSRVTSQGDSGRAWTIGDAAERLSVGFTQVPPAAATRPAFGDPEGPRRDPVGTVRSHGDGSRAVKVSMGDDTPEGQHVWCSMDVDLTTEWLDHSSVAEWGTEREWRLEELRRQLCLWCGHVLLDVPLANAPKPWPPASLVRIEDGVPTIEPYEPGDTLPPGCCALPDDGTPGPGCYPPADGWDGVSTATAEHCGKHVEGTSSNRCLLRTGHTGDHSDEFEPEPTCACGRSALRCSCRIADLCKAVADKLADGPDEAQETRAAADWPAEPEDGDRG